MQFFKQLNQIMRIIKKIEINKIFSRCLILG